MSLNVFSAAGNVRVKIYQDDGAGGDPSTLLGESGSLAVGGAGIQGFPVSATIPASGNVWGCFETDSAALNLRYTVSANAQKFIAHVYGAGPSPFGAAGTGNNAAWTSIGYSGGTPAIRVKVYQDDGGGGNPSTLLGESGTLIVNGDGFKNFTVSATSPASGNVWAGFETNDTVLDLYYQTGLANGTRLAATHTFGSGPNPFPTPSHSTAAAWSQITYTIVPIHVIFTWDGSALSTIPTPVITNSTGGFSGVTFRAPLSSFGGHTVNASDTVGLFNSKPFTITLTAASFNLTGIVIGPNGFFNYPKLTLISTSPANATQLWLLDNGVTVIQNKTFNPPIHLFANFTTTIPWNFTDARGITGDRNYTEQAVIQQGSAFGLVTSNIVTLHYGSFTIGKLNINQTNTNTIPIWFVRTNVNSSSTRVSVIFPNAANMTCNLSYQFAALNRTYFNMPNVTYDPTQKNSSFLFRNSTNDIITIKCRDINTNNSGSYILTQTVFPFIQQIQQFRAGTFGTTGQFGMLDIITLSIVIFSMIGFNRINEAVGAFFSIAIIGVAAYWGILTFPGVIAAAVAIVAVLAITSTRKTGGF